MARRPDTQNACGRFVSGHAYIIRLLATGIQKNSDGDAAGTPKREIPSR
jgi:hypothetical protein